MKPVPSEVQMLRRLMAISGLILLMVVARRAGDALGVRVPWYLLHEGVLLLVPMVWLMREVWPSLVRAERLAFIATSGLFISSSAIAELMAIEQRYWWFYTGLDPLSGFDLGGVPIEEFLSYPMLLNLPVLWFVWLKRVVPERPTLPEAPESIARVLRVGAWLAFGSAIGLALAGALNRGPLDVTTLPAPDAAGVIRYVAGPQHYGWTIIQLLAWAILLRVLIAAWPRLNFRRLALMIVTYFPFALFFELLACGRGWWVWNGNQTLGLTALVLPMESFSMYLTGAILPTLCFELIVPLCASAVDVREAPPLERYASIP